MLLAEGCGFRRTTFSGIIVNGYPIRILEIPLRLVVNNSMWVPRTHNPSNIMDAATRRTIIASQRRRHSGICWVTQIWIYRLWYCLWWKAQFVVGDVSNGPYVGYTWAQAIYELCVIGLGYMTNCRRLSVSPRGINCLHSIWDMKGLMGQMSVVVITLAIRPREINS